MTRVNVGQARRREGAHLERGEGEYGENSDPFVSAAVSEGNVQSGDHLESLEIQLIQLLAVHERSIRVQGRQSTSGTSRKGEGEVAGILKHRKRSLVPLFAVVAARDRAC